jgi:hypothetical protein
MEASVSEIHSYPLRPEGFEEPLFSTRESRLAVLDHLLLAPWLSQAAHARWEPVELENRHGRVRIVWASGRCRKRRHVVEVLGRWREVRAWWDERRAKNRSLARVLLSDGSVVDLAREKDGEWFLVGVTD